MQTAPSLCGSQYKGVQVTTASFRTGAAGGRRQELAPSNPEEAVLEHSGLPSELCPFLGKMSVREKLAEENLSTSGSYLQEAQRPLEQALPPLGAHSRRTPGYPLSDMT